MKTHAHYLCSSIVGIHKAFRNYVHVVRTVLKTKMRIYQQPFRTSRLVIVRNVCQDWLLVHYFINVSHDRAHG